MALPQSQMLPYLYRLTLLSNLTPQAPPRPPPKQASSLPTGQTQWTKPSSSSAPTAIASVSAAASTASFIAADAFSGPRQGYVYKQGSQGTGYYKDLGPMAVQGGLPLEQLCRRVCLIVSCFLCCAMRLRNPARCSWTKSLFHHAVLMSNTWAHHITLVPAGTHNV